MPAMNQQPTGILAEIAEAPEAVRRQRHSLAGPLTDLIARCRRAPPRVVVTCARGSSAHAATFGKHLIERHLGIPVAPAAPNIATVYRRRMELKDQLLLTISQSGRSDDLIEFTAMARAAGAITACIVNDPASPLADRSAIVLPMEAGAEHSIAATKSFIATLAALLRLAAAWTDDVALTEAIERLPDRLVGAGKLDWTPALDVLTPASSLVTIGRGPTLAIAREAALKLKEICDLQAEPFSSAEFQHGPMALVTSEYPVLMFMPTDEAAAGMRDLAADLVQKGAVLAVFDHAPANGERSALAPDHPDTDAVCLIQGFYPLAVRLAERRGIGGEHPRHLQKVTRTR
jgi:glucosamine--fructose-6-phosphate aminotransferase (isomerizing)